MRILVTGSNGQLGSEIQELAPNFKKIIPFFTDVDTLDITKVEEIDKYVIQNNIELIINCAAYTAVDKAEDEEITAKLINAEAVENLVHVAEKNNLKLIHISTDYVFDGSKNIPYTEEDQTNPNSIYGRTKLEGEKIITESDIPWIIIRTSWLYSSYGNNFVKTILRIGETNDEIKVVFDQIGTPTYAKDLAYSIFTIIDQTIANENNYIKGIYHFSNEGVCSWYDFALEILKLRNIDCYVRPVLSFEFPTKAKRPCYSVLNKQKISRTFNIIIPHWTRSLNDCIKKM